MKRLLTATAVAALSTLTLAGPAQADEASFFAYLRDHSYTTGNIWLLNPETQVDTAYKYCSLMRTGTPASSFPSEPVLVEAAQHELCPDTLSLPAPAPADEASFHDYLRDHNYTTGNIWLLNPQTQINTGYKYCSMIRSGTPASSFHSEPVLVEAAQHELCPDTLR